MEDITKNKAKKKLNKMKFKIGYPLIIDDYSNLKLSGSYLQQRQLLAWHNFILNVQKLSQKNNEEVWGIGAHEVNAYYSPIQNEIVLPVGILQPPFFDILKSDLYNYGSIGAVIGHEICHGFDDQGRLFDENGNMNNWWTEKDNIKYHNKTDILIKQYDELSIHNHKLNGKLTLGENIADVCGLTNALDALKYVYEKKHLLLTDKDKDVFFKAYGQLWRQKVKKEEVIKRLNIDPHSPGIYRVNQVLKNIPEFYTTYNIKSWNKMYLPEHMRFKFWE
jgi:putative endopeptidase